jgi:hypothetical protein
MIKRQKNNKKLETTCQKTKEVINTIYEPVVSLKKLIIEVCIIIGVIVFIFSPSIVLLVPFLLNFGTKLFKKDESSL